MDVLAFFKQDRERAREQNDPMASVCTVATIDELGHPQVRTLVLRDIEESLAIFVNATSPKWSSLQNKCAMHTYWPSVQIQYRMQVRTEPLPQDIVHASWQLRPDAPKHMDWLYESGNTQSSQIGSREELLAKLDSLQPPEPLIAPGNARGLKLIPQEIERLDLNQDNGVHDRALIRLTDTGTQTIVLIP